MDIHWMSASELAQAIAAGELTSVEVLTHLSERIQSLDHHVNAVVQWDLDRAHQAATEADKAVKRAAADGTKLAPLHGVPMTIKDSFQTEGCITTSGAPELADFVPSADAWPVAQLRQAGAIPFAKTNLPIWAGDVQSFNDVYGTTNNPYDPSRTPGGSSGGSSAALAMGFSPIELGSDIGGSIRVPAHYAGVMGHKPSYGIVPGHGQIPGMPGTLSQADLAVVGPMARSVRDLRTCLSVLAGADRWNSPAWKLKLPPPRARKLSDVRIAAWIDDDFCPVGSETHRVLSDLCTHLRDRGAKVDDEARPAFTLEKASRVFMRLLSAAMSGGYKVSELDGLAADTEPGHRGDSHRASAMRHREWLTENERRLQMREQWATFFTDFDIMLMPVHPCPAIPHDHSPDQTQRTIRIDGKRRSYMDLFPWMAPAGLGLLPATVVPVGRDAGGLPIGVQIVGPYLHDLTTLRMAELIADLRGGCPQPLIAR